MRIITAGLASLLLGFSLAPPVAAQVEGVTLAEVERRYRRMNEVHILKCDYDGNQIFTRTELFCIQGIYRSFYLDRD